MDVDADFLFLLLDNDVQLIYFLHVPVFVAFPWHCVLILQPPNDAQRETDDGALGGVRQIRRRHVAWHSTRMLPLGRYGNEKLLRAGPSPPIGQWHHGEHVSGETLQRLIVARLMRGLRFEVHLWLRGRLH